MNLSDPALQKIRDLTWSDSTLLALIELAHTERLVSKLRWLARIQPYFHIRNQLGEKNGILHKSSQCVILPAMRNEALQKVHSSHQGFDASLRRARETIFWTGMSAQIKDYVGWCNICAELARAQTREALQPTPLPWRPFETVGTDLFQLNGKDNLVSVDNYSSY